MIAIDSKDSLSLFPFTRKDSIFISSPNFPFFYQYIGVMNFIVSGNHAEATSIILGGMGWVVKDLTKNISITSLSMPIIPL
jgi:hypothetical protein